MKYKKKNKNKNTQGRTRANTPDKGHKPTTGYDTIMVNGGGSLGPHPNASHSPISVTMSMGGPVSPLGETGGLISGNILKTALTNPAEVAHFRHRENLVSSTRDRHMSLSVANSFINGILKCEDSSDIAMVKVGNKIKDRIGRTATVVLFCFFQFFVAFFFLI